MGMGQKEPKAIRKAVLRGMDNCKRSGDVEQLSGVVFNCCILEP
jgi:hypothetical protein